MNNSNFNNDLNTLKIEKFSWTTVQSEMKNKLGLEVYESWLKKINFVEEFNNYILLTVPTRFIRDWITSRYLDQILQIIKNYKKDIIRIEFKIADQKQVRKEIENGSIKNNENISFIKDSFFSTIELIPIKDLIIF